MAYSKAPYGIMGDGRLARHFAHYLTLLGLPYIQWSRGAARDTGQAPIDAFGPCDRILILVNDSAIEPVIRACPELEKKILIHCSGCLVTPHAHGAHPLMTFGPDLYTLSVYQSIPFILESLGESPGPTLENLLPGLQNPSYKISPDLKPLYHSLCVMGGSFSTLLWQRVFEEFEKRLGIPSSAAVPYLRQITENLATNPRQALTGPMVRKDRETVKKNLAALAGTDVRTIYEAFLDVFAPDMKDVKESKEAR